MGDTASQSSSDVSPPSELLDEIVNAKEPFKIDFGRLINSKALLEPALTEELTHEEMASLRFKSELEQAEKVCEDEQSSFKLSPNF
jgi:hypothetical protein